MNEQVKEKVDHLKKILDGLSDEEIRMIIRGERPQHIDREDFKVIKKTMQDQINKRLSGKVVYPARKPIYNKEGKLEYYENVGKPYIKDK